MSGPETVVLDDLADPRFPPGVADLMEAAAASAAGIELSESAVLGQATAETGLDDFGGDSFREPLAVLLASVRDEADLSGFGLVSVHAQLVQLARNRLLVTDLLRRHPEAAGTELEPPIIIAGLPRTGTTHLHHLLAADPALRSLPYWESLEPVALPTDDPAADPGPRMERTRVAVDFTNAALPHLPKMHEMTVEHRHEEIQLLGMEFSTMFFDTLAPMPGWRAWYRAHDQTPHYEYLATVLRVLSFLRGPRRWVLKSPQHLEQFAVLRRVFPDATVVVTHRDPVAVTASMATMIAYTARLQLARVDPVAIGSYWADRVAELLDACLRQRDLLAPERSLDVRLDELTDDEDAVVSAVYERAGIPRSAAAASSQRAYLAAHPRGRHGWVRASPADLGLDVEGRRSAFAAYSSRFGVRPEPVAGT